MKLASILEKCREYFVTKEVFALELRSVRDEITPIQRILYGFISIILISVATYIVGGVIKKP